MLTTNHLIMNSPTRKPSSNDFLCAIVHELKTPLNAVVGFSELLQREVKNSSENDNEREDYAKEINIAAIELNELIHDLLDVGSGVEGEFKVDLSKEIDVKEVIMRSLKLNRDYAIRMGIMLKTEIAKDLPLMRLDMKRMKQIVTNLVSNAIKYSPAKSEVVVSVGLGKREIDSINSAEFLEISVLDHGFGMTPNQVRTAFEKYQTIDNPNSGKVDSFGMGLPMVKILTELQGGSVEVKSEPEKGSKFSVRFLIGH